MSVFDRAGALPAVLALALAPVLFGSLTQPAEAFTNGAPAGYVDSVLASSEVEACRFAIRAHNTLSQDVWVLFTQSNVHNQRVNTFSRYLDGMQDRRLAPGERMDARFEAPGACGAPRFWYFDVRIGSRGGTDVEIQRYTGDRNERTIDLGDSACWTLAERPSSRNLPVIGQDDEAIGCVASEGGEAEAPRTDPGDDAHADVENTASEVDVDQFQGDWIRVETNNPRNFGGDMRIRVEGGRATITTMPPRLSSPYGVGQVIWDDLSADGSLAVLGSDGAFYPAQITMEGSNRLHLDIDLANSPGNDQTWERAGPSIDGDWVLYYTLEEHEQNWGLRVRVEGDRATIRYVPPTADRGYRVGDIIWREFSPSDHSSSNSLYSFESLFGGSTHEPAHMFASTYDDGSISSISIDSEASTRPQLWGRPEVAEEVFAKGVGEDEDEDALLDLPREPVGDPSAQDPDLEPSDDMKTVDQPELTPPVREPAAAACLATSLRHDETDLSWSWGLSIPPSTEHEMDAALPRYEHLGRRYSLVVDVERSRVPDLDDHHSYIRQANSGQRLGKDHRELTASELDTRIASYRDQGFRLIDIEGYSTSAGTRYAGVWVENREGVDWLSDFDLTSSEYGTLYQERRESGYRLVDVEAYPMSSGVRFAGIWYRSCDNSNWRQNRNLTEAQFEARAADLSSRGFNIVDFESYETPQGQLYGAIWEQVPSRAWTVARDQSLKWFLNHHRRYVDEGFRLIDYESYETAEGIRYAGVWAENDPRYDWAATTMIESSIRDYRAQNDLPGISVVIIQNGNVVYRRGFGWADREAQKRAHSETVYLTASISKVIGATLAARLEERGLLGLADPTADYLEEPVGMVLVERDGRTSYEPPESIPGHHTHTVEQLLSKTGCVPHYEEGIEPDTSRHYTWRVEALDQIWNDSLLANCTPGQHYHYSTHGFTYVGAVLEAVTNKDIAQLLQDELAQRFEMLSLRAMFNHDGIQGYPPNYDRAKAYTLTDTDNNPHPQNNPTIPTNYENNSWKVLGGGIEMHAVDLARFGWKILDGEIVSESTRDGRLWDSLTDDVTNGGDVPGDGVGLAWVLGDGEGTTGGRRMAHGGSARGAGSYFKIWPDQGLVIAMLSNRKDHDNSSRYDFFEELADTVLAATTSP